MLAERVHSFMLAAMLSCATAVPAGHRTEFQIARGTVQSDADGWGGKHSRMIDNELIAQKDTTVDATAAGGHLPDVSPPNLVRNETLHAAARTAKAEARAAEAADKRAAAKAERKQAAAARKAERHSKRKAARGEQGEQGERQQASHGRSVGAGPAALVALDAAAPVAQVRQEQQQGGMHTHEGTFARAAASSRSQARAGWRAARRARAQAKLNEGAVATTSDVALDRLNEGMRH